MHNVYLYKTRAACFCLIGPVNELFLKMIEI